MNIERCIGLFLFAIATLSSIDFSLALVTNDRCPASVTAKPVVIEPHSADITADEISKVQNLFEEVVALYSDFISMPNDLIVSLSARARNAARRVGENNGEVSVFFDFPIVMEMLNPWDNKFYDLLPTDMQTIAAHEIGHEAFLANFKPQPVSNVWPEMEKLASQKLQLNEEYKTLMSQLDNTQSRPLWEEIFKQKEVIHKKLENLRLAENTLVSTNPELATKWLKCAGPNPFMMDSTMEFVADVLAVAYRNNPTAPSLAVSPVKATPPFNANLRNFKSGELDKTKWDLFYNRYGGLEGPTMRNPHHILSPTRHYVWIKLLATADSKSKKMVISEKIIQLINRNFTNWKCRDPKTVREWNELFIDQLTAEAAIFQ